MKNSQENISEIESIASAVLHKLQTELPVYRDSRDVQAIRRKDFLIMFMAIVMMLLAILSGLLYLKRPTVNTIVKTADGQRVISVNDREFGCGEPVELGKDNLSADDKTYLANQFAKWIYGVYLPSRDKDIEKALSLIEDKKFLKDYSSQLTAGQLQLEKSEQWNAVWKAQKISVDTNNPMIIRIIGTQELKRVDNNVAKATTIQYELTFELTTDNRRDDDDLRTGFKIVRFNGAELSRNEENSI